MAIPFLNTMRERACVLALFSGLCLLLNACSRQPSLKSMSVSLPATPLSSIPAGPSSETGPPSQKDLDKAQAYVKAHPENAAALINMGELALAVGKMSEGVHALQQATRMAPNNPLSWLSYAHLCQEGGYLFQETEALKQLVRLDTNQPEVYVRLADIYIDLHWFTEAAPLLKKAQALTPSNSDVKLAQAQLLFDTGHTPSAVSVLEKMNSAPPANPEIVSLLASYCNALHNLDKEEAYYPVPD